MFPVRTSSSSRRADDLLRGQAFGNGDLMRHHPAFDYGRDHVAHAGVRLELILAGLETLARLEHEHAADEHPRLIDDAVAHQHIGDVADAGTARDIDDAVLTKRPRCIETLLAEYERDAGHDGHQHEKADDRVADDDERIPRAFGAACRHFDSVRFEGRSRAARRNGFGILRSRGIGADPVPPARGGNAADTARRARTAERWCFRAHAHLARTGCRRRPRRCAGRSWAAQRARSGGLPALLRRGRPA